MMGTKIFSVTWRRRISRCTSRWEMMEGIHDRYWYNYFSEGVWLPSQAQGCDVCTRSKEESSFRSAMLEDRGYDVIFNKGKDFLRHIAMGQVKQIGVRVKNLYKLDVEDCVALSTKAEKVQSRDVGELWHRRLGHLHHGALKIMQQISTGLPKGALEQWDTCKGCTLGKYTKSTFNDRDNKAHAVLERIHSDVCGPFSTASTAKHNVLCYICR
jgi:hypothetical protein